MRNKIVHDYGYVDLTIVYDTVIHGIPDMYEKLESIRETSNIHDLTFTNLNNDPRLSPDKRDEIYRQCFTILNITNIRLAIRKKLAELDNKKKTLSDLDFIKDL